MRLWHKDLIPVLPRQQLLGQWRECCLIAKNITEKGFPNHILVNRIMEYPLSHFCSYAALICNEMINRGYDCNLKKVIGYFPFQDYNEPYGVIFFNWHNDRYLRQCYYNLEEKYDCGKISKEEWDLIKDNTINF